MITDIMGKAEYVLEFKGKGIEEGRNVHLDTV